MSRQAYSLIYLNMAGEMCYILNCRLRTNKFSILQDFNRIMSDLTFVLFDEDVVRETFEPRDQFCEAIVLRRQFTKLVHWGGIFRDGRADPLNMVTIYDLTTAMVKSQLLDCGEPEKILSMTQRHLEWICTFLLVPEERMQIEYAFHLFWEAFSGMNRFELNLVRQTAINFFKGGKIETDLLLESGLHGLYGPVHIPLVRTLNQPGAPIDRNTGRVEADAALFVSGVQLIIKEAGESSMNTSRRQEKDKSLRRLEAAFVTKSAFTDSDGSEQSTSGEAIGVPVEFVSKREQSWKTVLIKPDDDKRICGFSWIRSKLFK